MEYKDGVVVTTREGMGRVLQAVRDFAPGDLVLRERPLLSVGTEDSLSKYAGLSLHQRQQLGEMCLPAHGGAPRFASYKEQECLDQAQSTLPPGSPQLREKAVFSLAPGRPLVRAQLPLHDQEPAHGSFLRCAAPDAALGMRCMRCRDGVAMQLYLQPPLPPPREVPTLEAAEWRCGACGAVPAPSVLAAARAEALRLSLRMQELTCDPPAPPLVATLDRTLDGLTELLESARTALCGAHAITYGIGAELLSRLALRDVRGSAALAVDQLGCAECAAAGCASHGGGRGGARCDREHPVIAADLDLDLARDALQCVAALDNPAEFLRECGAAVAARLTRYVPLLACADGASDDGVLGGTRRVAAAPR
ncbi:hypothetical protein JKP88DRAFT_244323 [Tribonema minus]|uniref:Uncharacterized protein n=1 Tax=Tribonema minus TaxID=303371 RepID=A0A835Z1C9_9STRA|nr:hypothetical protein JKP88DRAFT_244323 [Tribonema minus]